MSADSTASANQDALPRLEIRSSPHMVGGHSVDSIMMNVVLALLPVTVFAIYLFGLAAAATILTAVVSCVLTEHWLCRLAKRPTTITDRSVLITGLIYGLTLPPGLPLWMTALGGFIAVALGKFLFGGLGYNAFNPALVGRAFLQTAFPAAMTNWHPVLGDDRFSNLPSSCLALPFSKPDYDGISAATPLARMKFEQEFQVTPDLLFGLHAGSVGETGAVLILLGGAYLVWRNMMNWRIPAAIFFTVAILSGLLNWFDPHIYAGPLFMLFTGGLMLGAVFMATDMVASPITATGAVIYGMLIGVLVILIRNWGGMPEGVMYAILIANALSPHLDNLIQPRTFGSGR